MYGGRDKSHRRDSLYQLDTESLDWSQLPSGPMKMTACGMVSYEDKLILFGGYGIPSGPTQLGAEFTKNNQKNDGSGRTNELHIFDVQKGEWSSPTLTETRPPPCSAFSFTKVDQQRAVIFGGRISTHGLSNHVYILDLKTMHWSVLNKDKEPWPVGRSGHAAVCLWNGEDHPQMLVTGGRDNNEKILSDAWILDLQTGSWREVEVSSFKERYFHSATAFSLCPGVMEVTLFGGMSYNTDSNLQFTANTTVLRFEYHKHSSSAGLPTGEWILTDMAESSQLGTRQRIQEKSAKMIKPYPHHQPLL